MAPGPMLPTADASVRRAGAGDVPAIAAVQVRAWRSAYPELLDDTLNELNPELMASTWHAAVAAPPSPAHAVWVACAADIVVGFAAVARSDDRDATDSDGQIVVLAVDPAHQRAGHGSRLLAAATEHLQAHGLTTVAAWTPERDTARQSFLSSAGLQADGARRSLGRGDQAEVTELRYLATLDRVG